MRSIAVAAIMVASNTAAMGGAFSCGVVASHAATMEVTLAAMLFLLWKKLGRLRCVRISIAQSPPEPFRVCDLVKNANFRND
jgi:hypothetical protein